MISPCYLLVVCCLGFAFSAARSVAEEVVASDFVAAVILAYLLDSGA
jgi:hypothetical protein